MPWIVGLALLLTSPVGLATELQLRSEDGVRISARYQNAQNEIGRAHV
jgi:hypothetical protein